MIINRFLILVLVSSVLYLVLHLFLNDVFLYTIGGVLGTILKIFSQQVNVPLLVLLWIALLGTSAFFYYRAKSKPIKYFLLSLVFFLMYVVDFILYEILLYETSDANIRLFNSAVMILGKSLILSLIIYFENKSEKGKASIGAGI